jgi:hypothetical protein
MHNLLIWYGVFLEIILRYFRDKRFITVFTKARQQIYIFSYFDHQLRHHEWGLR